jgi:signal transduction histidine kinase
MQERARLIQAELTVESTPGEGTRVQVLVPLG